MNEEQTIVIIGCGAGGGTAAQFARKTNRKATIEVFEQGKYPQYSKCGLPYVIAGEIQQPTDLIEFTTEWFTKENINLHLETVVQNVNIKDKTLTYLKQKKKHTMDFDKLILATGATPFLPPIKNLKKNNQPAHGIHVVRTIEDIQQIQQQVDNNKSAVIIGAGLIGIEMAEALYHCNMDVTLIEALPTVLATTMDKDMCTIVEQYLAEKITIYTNYLATEIHSKQKGIQNVSIENRKTHETTDIPADIIIIAAGLRPNTELAKSVGCTIGQTGGIVVNHHSQTSVDDVYAVGDCTEYMDLILNRPVGIGLGSIAVRQGIAAGINAAGGSYQLPKGVILTRTSKFFDMEIAAVGPISSSIQDHETINGKFTGSSLPEYFPGGKKITIKAIADKQTGTLLAAQAVGENVAQRINTLAVGVLNQLSIEDLRKLETAYAPPVAPTLDTVTLVCDVVSLKRNRRK